MNSSHKARSAAGFTLIEIAVVLVIAGLLTAGLLTLLNSILSASRARATSANAETVKQALDRFVTRYGRLPCPAIPTLPTTSPVFGQADSAASCGATAVPGATTIARGVVPWITLGITPEQAQDGFYRMFTYHVTVTATTTNQATVTTMRGVMTVHTATPTLLGLPSAGGNQSNSCAAPPATNDVNGCNLRAAVILISQGQNGAGAFVLGGGQLPAPTSAAEIENTDNNIAFLNTTQSANVYDDIIYAWTPDDFLDPLARQGAIKSATTVTNDALRNTEAAIVNLMVNAATAAPSSSTIPANAAALGLLALPNDGWGNALVYTAVGAGNVCAVPANGTVFTLKSTGVDGVVGANAATNRNDDITVTTTVNLIRAQINNRLGNAC
jgi:prepilin-type N-terminal cleavage/methylation domain-containing protein